MTAPQAVSLLILLSVFLGLLGAAVYAVLGTPRTAGGKKRRKEVISGFQLAGGILLGFFLISFVLLGVGVALSSQVTATTWVSHAAAIALSVVSLGLIAVMAQRWAKYFTGWVGYGVLNGLVMISGGHLLNNPAIPVRRPFAIAMTALCFFTALASLRFTAEYRLNWADRVALVGWILAFAVSANVERCGVPALTVGFLLLLGAWLYGNRVMAATQ